MPRLTLFIFGCLLTLGGAAQQKLAVHPDTSFTIYSAFVKAKKTQPFISIARPPAAGFKTEFNIPYTKVGDRELLLDVFSPASSTGKAAPAVLLVFGGGWRSGDRDQLSTNAKVLAAKGFIAITADYRLSTEALYPAAVIDLKTAVKWIRANAKTYRIDPDKIAVMGFSAGGQLAALLAGTPDSRLFPTTDPRYAKYSDKVQALIDVDGILAFIHPESGEGDDSKAPSAATLWFGTPKSAGTEKWEEAAPLRHVSSKNPPVLFLNSSVNRMHAGRDDMIKKLDSLHIYSEVHTFSDAPHPFPLFEPWFTPAMDYVVGFLGKVFVK